MKQHSQPSKNPETVQPKSEKQASVGAILAGYGNTFQKQGIEEEPLQKKANDTGLPDNLKSGVENLSSIGMDDVKVHYNSSQPSQLNAHAYAQGTDIHVAPGQEQHVPHEAWHVVQQKQGRVKPTMQMKGKVNVNDDVGLENEADVMGAKAVQMKEDKILSTPTSTGTNLMGTYQLIEIAGKLKKAVESWAGDKAQEVIDWFEPDDDKTGIEAALKMKFSDWWKNVRNNDGSTPAVAVPNPYAEVNAKINATAYDLSKFTPADKDEVIKNQAASKNWTTSIKSVYDDIIAREEKAVRAAHIAKFTNAKGVGDTLFTNGLLLDVWNRTYGIFLSQNASINDTLDDSYDDDVINAAAAIWHARNVINPAGAVASTAKSITNLHIPGAPDYIEDKSTREDNPDPDRGRQADFISEWGNLKINVHVNSTQEHDD